MLSVIVGMLNADLSWWLYRSCCNILRNSLLVWLAEFPAVLILVLGCVHSWSHISCRRVLIHGGAFCIWDKSGFLHISEREMSNCGMGGSGEGVLFSCKGLANG